MDKANLILGRTEWVSLPGLSLSAIKAKIDTGAKTSALHAHAIEPFGSGTSLCVRFVVHPIPLKPRIAVRCEAPVKDLREVTSSNGEKEARYIIETELTIGDRTWPIELGLTNREALSHRMLIGRQGLPADAMVDPAGAYRQPRLSSRLYRSQGPRKRQD